MSEEQPFEGISAEAIQSEILSRKDEITQAVVTNLVNTISNQSHYSLNAEISAAVNSIVKEQLMAEIKAAVVAAKPLIMESLAEAISKVCSQIGTVMLKKAGENIAGYRGREIIEKLFQ